MSEKSEIHRVLERLPPLVDHPRPLARPQGRDPVLEAGEFPDAVVVVINVLALHGKSVVVYIDLL